MNYKESKEHYLSKAGLLHCNKLTLIEDAFYAGWVARNPELTQLKIENKQLQNELDALLKENDRLEKQSSYYANWCSQLVNDQIQRCADCEYFNKYQVMQDAVKEATSLLTREDNFIKFTKDPVCD